jgi:hypothetical protein
MVTGWSQMNRANINNARREVSRSLRNKKREYLKDKINELATHSKNKNRGINKFMKGYQPRTKLVKMRMTNCLLTPTTL